MAEVVVFDIDAQSAIQKLAQLRADTNALKEAQKQLAEEVKKGNKDAATSYEANAIILKNVANEQRVLSRAVEGYSAVQKSATDTTNFANNSIQENRDLLKQLTATYIGLKNPTKEQTEQIRKLSDQLKEQESAIGNNVRNVGNYQGALKNAVSEIRLFGVSIGDAQTTFNTYSNALKDAKTQLAAYVTGQKAADGATKLSILSTGGLAASMNVLRLALIATGVGAFVVLLGSLVAAFASTERGADLLEDALANVTGVVKSLFGEAQKLGVQLIDIFSNPKKSIKELVDFLQGNLLNRLKSFGVILDGILERDTKKITNGIAQLGTGVENLTDKLENGAKKGLQFLSDSAKKQQQIVNIQRELEDLEGAINKRRAENATRETELLIIAKSINSTQKERKAATDEILKNTAELQKLEEDIVKKKIEALKLTQSQNITDREGNKELQDLEAELIKVQAAGKDKQLQLIKLLNKEQKDQNKATKEELKKTEFDLVKFNEKVRTDELQKTLDNLKINTEQQELLVKEQYANGIINKQQYEAELQRIGLESYDAQIIALSDYGEQILEKEIERQNAVLDQTIINNEKAKQLSEDLKEQELLNQQIIQDAKIEGVNGLIQIAQIAAGENQKLAKIFLVAEKAVAIAEIIINLQRQLASNATVAAANPLNAATFGAAGAAQLVALNTLSKVRAGIGIATIAATTIKDVALPKKAEGGEISIDGKSHAQGGEIVTVGGRAVAEVEGGEGLYVMKKNAYQKIKQFSAINEAFGGKSWLNGSSKFLADGGAINTTLPILESRGRVNNTIEQNRLLSQALRQLPAPVLSIKEFEKKQAVKDKSVRIAEL
jgi:hypothetical protein